MITGEILFREVAVDTVRKIRECPVFDAFKQRYRSATVGSTVTFRDAIDVVGFQRATALQLLHDPLAGTRPGNLHFDQKPPLDYLLGNGLDIFDAQPILVSMDIWRALGASSFPEDFTHATAADLPFDPRGRFFLVFDHPCGVRAEDPEMHTMQRMQIIAAFFQVVQDADGPFVAGTLIYTSEERERKMEFGVQFVHWPLPIKVGTDSLVDGLLNLRAFMNSKYPTTGEERVPRQMRRRCSSPPPLVRTVLLRKIEGRTRRAGERASEHEFCWMVRGHTRWQYYSTRGVHELIWIQPHLKGPKDKPLKPSEPPDAAPPAIVVSR